MPRYRVPCSSSFGFWLHSSAILIVDEPKQEEVEHNDQEGEGSPKESRQTT